MVRFGSVGGGLKNNTTRWPSFWPNCLTTDIRENDAETGVKILKIAMSSKDKTTKKFRGTKSETPKVERGTIV